MIAALAVIGAVAILAAAVIVAAVSRRPLTCVAERRAGARVLRATPSYQRRPGRLPAASTAGPFVVTSLPAAQPGARANERN